MNNRRYFFEEIIEKEENDGINIIELESLDEDEKTIINPSVPPTSGLRMEIFDIEGNDYTMTKKKTCHFLRVIAAFAVVTKKELHNQHPSILIVTDDRPSADKLLDYASRIFYYEGYKIFHQLGEGEQTKGTEYIRGKSKMSSPYASASVVLIDEIDVVLMLTASHNSLEWNGLKYYIKRPMPLSGTIMKDMSAQALSFKDTKLSMTYTAELIDADKINNDYIIKLVRNIVDLDVLKGKKIIFWPLLGAAPEIISLLESCGSKISIIDEDTDPPNPNEGFDEEKVKSLMKSENAQIAIILDADRDRLVFLTDFNGKVFNLSPNELFVAMHNILSSELNKQLINVRTIPSDPRCDESSKFNFITGVGYKHLGLIQYLLADENVPQSQFDMGILYYLLNNRYIKLSNKNDIKKAFFSSGINFEVNQNLIFILWEESGGHTFNILNSTRENDEVILRSDYPLIGDKYPAPAILVLCSLISMGYNLTEYIDQSLLSGRKYIKANDSEKLKYMKYFGNKIGQKIKVGNSFEYEIGTFSDMFENVKTLHLKSKKSNLYIRPSGTGPNIKIYIYGPKDSYLEEMEKVADFINGINI